MKKSLSPSEEKFLMRASGEIDPELEKKVDIEIKAKFDKMKDECEECKESTDLESEINAIRSIAVIECLDVNARYRVIRWAVDRFLPSDWRSNLG